MSATFAGNRPSRTHHTNVCLFRLSKVTMGSFFALLFQIFIWRIICFRVNGKSICNRKESLATAIKGSKLTSLEYELDVFACTIRLCLIALNEMENGSNVCLNFLSCVFFTFSLFFFCCWLATGWKTSHVHEKIECKGCFAYVPEEICQHHISDLNVFSVCQVSVHS
jgi:hypothetical protein